MLWFSLSALSATAKAANQAATKTLTSTYSVLAIAAFGQLAAGISVFPLILVPGLVAIPGDLDFHRAAFVTISLNIAAILLLVEAIRGSELSYALPFLGLTPVFTILTAWVLRGEVIGLVGVLGILLVFLGTMSIDAGSLPDWAKLGGRRIFRDRGVRLVVCVALIYSISSVYDKSATLLSDPYTFVWYSAVIRAVALLLLFFGRRRLWGIDNSVTTVRPAHILLFAFLGVTFIAEALFQMGALQTGPVAFVIAIKRLSILFTSLAGVLVFKEAFSLARLSGAVLIVAGVTIIYLS
ncbi:MAG: DMT family transporter [Desulfobulbaceae bacterium]|jgi:drug/metabolite transporter (DMT)-like permease|nr:DMT family transporter [Desulfobulbaceae bacterium]MDY0352341.1 DMT family transporter [Desulfobulbaceae bacterium]